MRLVHISEDSSPVDLDLEPWRLLSPPLNWIASIDPWFRWQGKCVQERWWSYSCADPTLTHLFIWIIYACLTLLVVFVWFNPAYYLPISKPSVHESEEETADPTETAKVRKRLSWIREANSSK